MKNLYFTLALFVLSTPILLGQYYFSDERQIPLSVDSSKLLILFDQDLSFNIDDIIDDYQRIDSISDYTTVEGFRVASLSHAENYSDFLDSLRQNIHVSMANPYFVSSHDSTSREGVSGLLPL